MDPGHPFSLHSSFFLPTPGFSFYQRKWGGRRKNIGHDRSGRGGPGRETRRETGDSLTAFGQKTAKVTPCTSMNVLSHPQPHVNYLNKPWQVISWVRKLKSQKTKLLSWSPQEFGNKRNTIPFGELNHGIKSEEAKEEMFKANLWRQRAPRFLALDWDL